MEWNNSSIGGDQEAAAGKEGEQMIFILLLITDN
jgi:hypothetical protein